MSQKFNNLQSLIESDHAAMAYWGSLPDYVKDHIQQRGDNVNSLESLMDYAENLLRGDN